MGKVQTYEERRAAAKAASVELRQYRVGCVTPFMGGSGVESAGSVMRHALALTTFLASAFDDTQAVIEGNARAQTPEEGAVQELAGSIKAEALRGIEDLLSLSLFLVEAD